MRRCFIAGNWKMHGTLRSVHALLEALSAELNHYPAVEFAVFPPFIYIHEAVRLLSASTISVGAQNMSEFAQGAYTGEVSAAMLKDMGCRYVIIGHSERRQLFLESNNQVMQKCEMAFLAGLTPIICVGETLAEREQGLTLSVVQEQLAVVSVLKDNCTAFADVVIAYEPVWAIGTGKSASPEEAQIVHAAIRLQLHGIEETLAAKTRIVYGGSVKPDNASALFSMPDIDGALVGGASLESSQFAAIAKCAP